MTIGAVGMATIQVATEMRVLKWGAERGLW